MSIFDRIRTDLQRVPSVLVALGGHRHHRATLSTRMELRSGSLSELEETIESATTSQEIGSEIIQRLLERARNMTLETFGFDGEHPIDQVLDSIQPKCLVIVGPLLLARLQKESSFLNLAGSSEAFVSLPFTGLIGSHEVFLDPYHTGLDALVCLPGWFSFSAGAIIYEGRRIEDPIEQTTVQEFYDDVDFTIMGSLIKGLVPRL